MKSILVVGDSFMYPDKIFPNTHWTELVNNYNIINLSFPGMTNAQIFLNLIKGVSMNPDYVYLWFTHSKRFEFENRKSNHPVEYITDCNPELLDYGQTKLMQYYYAETPNSLQNQKSVLYILGSLSFLKVKNIKFLYSYGLFETILGELQTAHLQELDQFKKYYLQDADISNYTKEFVLSPSYHTDKQWQEHLAYSIVNALEK